ncbi:MAG: hypothetical protein A2927_02770 [Candidatus Komeilibacteria bacterium RIFCSPLOWO2_01_FULL_45_10]|uniref:Peptidase M15A C-terminal domain-containing protein n=1 Tax=Candidatus Komeilibacteria bacterium RIFCSPLOWO2_01_FULL_45_10 TaxID=1798550 RepID=A0A1G2BL93_9BACT|nr:MAG: hypothetical protein A2927_02770 [Candidatus Komeilibacteria bacterium RIFCSPLOWO2_01_FULL_45_10]
MVLRNKKLFIKGFLTSFLFLLLLVASVALAADIQFEPNVPIPGAGNINTFPEYIKALYKFLVGIAGILAVVMIAVGGLLWLFSGGDSGRITKAKEIILGAVIGLLLVLGSYMILNTINPNLVKFKLFVPPVTKLTLESSQKGCCLLGRRMVPGNPSSSVFFSSCQENITSIQCDQFFNDEKKDEAFDAKEFYEEGLCGGGVGGWAARTEYSCSIPTGWMYDPNVELQTEDSSNELFSLLDCLRPILDEQQEEAKKKLGRISSISNSNHIGDLAACRQQNDRPSDCVHQPTSCHYGGSGGSDDSYAVDIGDDENDSYLQVAFRECDEFIKAAYREGDHIHLSTPSCQSDAPIKYYQLHGE